MKNQSAFPGNHIQGFEYGDQLRRKGGVRGRFAPTPSGDLRLGNLRTALIAWLRVRLSSGKFILRIDDLDTPRNRPGAIEKIKDDLLWLGLVWDEPVVLQSKRKHIYQEVIAALTTHNIAYPCICSRKMLLKERLNSSGPFIFRGNVETLNMLHLI